jgi:hypothetical protein
MKKKLKPATTLLPSVHLLLLLLPWLLSPTCPVCHCHHGLGGVLWPNCATGEHPLEQLLASDPLSAQDVGTAADQVSNQGVAPGC